MPSLHRITDHGPVQTAMGPARRVQVEREDGAAMGWREVWEAFTAAYPGCWGVMLFPPRERLLDQANRYHLHVVEAGVVEGMDLW